MLSMLERPLKIRRVAFGLVGLWLIAAYAIAPLCLRLVYDGKLPGASLVMSGISTTPLSEYLDSWSSLADSGTFATVTTLLLALVGLWIFKPYADRSDSGARASHTSDGMSLASMTFTGGWFGLWAGLGESYYLVGKWFVLGEPVQNFSWWFSADSLWMIPLVTTSTFALIGLAFGTFARLMRRRPSPRWFLSLMLFLLLLSWAAAPDRLYWWAAAILCAALAVRGSEAILRRPDEFERVRRTSGTAGLAVLGGLIVGVPMADRILENRRVREAGVAATGQPNLLVIILDTQRAGSTSLYDERLETTPNLERLAEGGLVFDRAMSTASWTLPSHASMFTGRFNFELKTGAFEPLDDRFLTLAEHLSAHGYATGGFVANIGYLGRAYGVDQGFQHYQNKPRTLAMAVQSPVLLNAFLFDFAGRIRMNPKRVRIRAPAVNRGFLEWVDRQPERPFFAFLNYFDAHSPFEPPATFTDSARVLNYHPAPFTSAAVDREADQDLSLEAVQQQEAAYQRGIRYLDHHVGSLVDQLERRGLLASTYIIITSDHGEAFGEHGEFGHKRSLFVEETHVPLLLLGPGIPSGARSMRPASLLDLPATALSLLRIENPFPGENWLDDPSSGAMSELDEYPSGTTLQLQAPNWWSILEGDLHYVRRPSGEEELYDLRSDPWEQTDLSDAPEQQKNMLDFRRQLAQRAPDDGRGS